MNNLINPLVIKKFLHKNNLTPQNKEQFVLLSKRKNSTFSAISRLTRKLKFKQSILDKKQKNNDE